MRIKSITFQERLHKFITILLYINQIQLLENNLINKVRFPIHVFRCNTTTCAFNFSFESYIMHQLFPGLRIIINICICIKLIGNTMMVIRWYIDVVKYNAGHENKGGKYDALCIRRLIILLITFKIIRTCWECQTTVVLKT